MSRLLDKVTGQTRVHINVSGSNGAGEKFSVQTTRTVAELGVAVGNGGAAPVYPGAEIAVINMRNDLNAAQKIAEAKKLTTAWEKADAEFKATGGRSIQNRIAEAVIAMIRKDHNVGDGNGNQWNIATKDITITPREEGGVVVINVNGAPVWG